MLRDKKQQQARALKMLESKILQGKTAKEIAKDFGVSPQVVHQAMSLAKKADIVVSFEDKLMNELLPLAYEATRAALVEGNAKIGMEIMKGAGIVRVNQPTTLVQAHNDHDLAAYITKKRQNALLEEQTIDATFTPTPLGLPPHVSSPSIRGDSTGRPGHGASDVPIVAGSPQISPETAQTGVETGDTAAQTPRGD